MSCVILGRIKKLSWVSGCYIALAPSDWVRVKYGFSFCHSSKLKIASKFPDFTCIQRISSHGGLVRVLQMPSQLKTENFTSSFGRRVITGARVRHRVFRQFLGIRPRLRPPPPAPPPPRTHSSSSKNDTCLYFLLSWSLEIGVLACEGYFHSLTTTCSRCVYDWT